MSDRRHYVGLWLFSLILTAFLGGTLYLFLKGQHAGVQRLGSLMVFAGTLSAFELLTDQSKVKDQAFRSEIVRLRSKIEMTREWVFGLQQALTRLEDKESVDLTAEIDAKAARDASFERLNALLERADEENEEARWTLDLHASLNTFLLVGIGTLQWGYGDLASAWLGGLLLD